MVMLLTVLAFAAPSLGRFFRGRSLVSESQRLLSLTRYGQSRAAAEGVPMVLWIDAQASRYGLEQAAGYSDTADARAVEFQAADGLRLEPYLSPTATRMPSAVLGASSLAGRGGLPTLRFEPDGSVAEGSPESVRILQDGSEAAWVSRTPNRLAYEIQTNPPVAWAR
jgi:Tfp pilus assembly protein FimT